MAHFDNLGARLSADSGEEKGWNQDKAARTIGASASQLSNYETGAKRPSLETFGRLLDGYGVRLGKFDDALDIVNDRRRPALLSEPTGAGGGDEPDLLKLLGSEKKLSPELDTAFRELLRGFIWVARAAYRAVVEVGGTSAEGKE
jgi:transcriptional regulator with XRE-family HTH domain